jgi:hypothetical protein
MKKALFAAIASITIAGCGAAECKPPKQNPDGTYQPVSCPQNVSDKPAKSDSAAQSTPAPEQPK